MRVLPVVWRPQRTAAPENHNVVFGQFKRQTQAVDRVTFGECVKKELTHKRAFVTGSTSGIGLAIAQRLAESGATIVMHGLETKADAREAIESVEAIAGKGRVFYVRGELSTVTKMKNVAERVKDKVGSIDILVNNAGFQHRQEFLEFDPQRFQDLLTVHLTAPFVLMQEFIPAMKEKGWGRVVNIGSAHSLVASPAHDKPGYVSAKHGVVGLTREAANAFAEDGITVNAICPGFVGTPLAEKQIAMIQQDKGISARAAKRELLVGHADDEFVKAEEVAGFVNFLCSRDGASINGGALPIERGWTSH